MKRSTFELGLVYLLRLSRNVTTLMNFLRCEEVTLHGRFKLSFGYILMVSLKELVLLVKLCVFLKENPFSWILLVNNLETFRF